VNFQTVGDWDNYGNSTQLHGTDIAPIVFYDFTSTQPTFQDGTITIIPEPINWALGLFACVFVGSATVRWVTDRRMSLQPVQIVSQGEPRA
jgi:hypothetical protein